MLTNEKKRQVFIELRMENYRASSRLEGLQVPQATQKKKNVTPTLAELKAKHVR